VPNLDDDRFEIYLKKFRPLAPVPLPLDISAEAARKRSRRAAIVLWALATAVAAILAVIMLRGHADRAAPAEVVAKAPIGEQPPISQPLTLGAANRLLANSSSFEAALDSLEAEAASVAIPKGKVSALAVLSQENLKP
jgi:hypothetical protein